MEQEHNSPYSQRPLYKWLGIDDELKEGFLSINKPRKNVKGCSRTGDDFQANHQKSRNLPQIVEKKTIYILVQKNEPKNGLKQGAKLKKLNENGVSEERERELLRNERETQKKRGGNNERFERGIRFVEYGVLEERECPKRVSNVSILGNGTN